MPPNQKLYLGGLMRMMDKYTYKLRC